MWNKKFIAALFTNIKTLFILTTIQKMISHALTLDVPMKKVLLLTIFVLPCSLFPMKPKNKRPTEFELVQIEERTDTKPKGSFNPQEALYRAAYNGEVNAAAAYLHCSQHINPDYTPVPGWTPLCAAAYNGHAEIVKMLLEKGANIYAKTPAGDNPLLLAAHRNHSEVITELIYYLDSNPDATDEHILQYLYSSDKHGNTAFSLAPPAAKNTLHYWLRKLTGKE
jgi:ankyrin repeat protein